MDDQVFLRQDVCVQPLVGRWNATEQLIPPLQSALNFKNVQIPLLKSYLEAPEFHWKAARTPSLIGGPWVDVHPDSAKRVEQFLSTALREQQGRLQLATDIEAVHQLLHERATGGGLANLYTLVPESLRGYAELVYDAAHQPGVRYLETLLYRSPHYDISLQSVSLSTIQGDARAAQFTTPLLEDNRAFRLDVPFSHPALDQLFLQKSQPGSFSSLCEQMGITRPDQARFRQFFETEQARFASSRPPESGTRIRYFGHACVLFESREASVLVDPVISYQYPAAARRYTSRDLPERIDCVALTHFHKDHVNLETLLQLRCRADCIVVPKNAGGTIQDPSFRQMLMAIGFRNVVELGCLESLALPGGAQITALPFFGEHADLDIQSKAAYRVRSGKATVLFAADSSNIEPVLYDRLGAEISDVDVLFLGMECVGAPLTTTYGGVLLRSLGRSFDQERRTVGSNYDQAMGIIDRVRPKHVYIYAMGLEPWLGHLLPIDANRDALGIRESDRVVAECRRRGMTASRPCCEMALVLPA